MIKRIFTGVPISELQMLAADIEADEGTPQQEEQGDGKLTVIATFPGELPGDRAEGGEPAWMTIARAEIGQKEGQSGASNLLPTPLK
jgi:hypothetical protein